MTSNTQTADRFSFHSLGRSQPLVRHLAGAALLLLGALPGLAQAVSSAPASPLSPAGIAALPVPVKQIYLQALEAHWHESADGQSFAALQATVDAALGSDGSFSLPPQHSGALSKHWLQERGAPACSAAPGSPPQGDSETSVPAGHSGQKRAAATTVAEVTSPAKRQR